MSSHDQIFSLGFLYMLCFFCEHACPYKGIYQFSRHLAESWEGDVMAAYGQAEIRSSLGFVARVQKL